MKRYCKNVNICSVGFLEICVEDCLRKKWHRHDAIRYFADITGNDESTIIKQIECNDKTSLIKAAARQLQSELKSHELHLTPIWYKQKSDPSSRKIRRIGIQNIKQQLYDYVAVYAMHDLMKRIGEYQCASIPNRGPIYGMKHVRKWLKDKRIKYAAQLDVKKCFPSIPQDKLLAMIDKYVANADVKWLVRQLVGTFDEGLSIGSYLSQYLCNLYMSQLYHEISENMYYMRRGKRINYVQHVLFYMDDILLLGYNASAMHKCVKAIITYAHDKMGLEIKPTWSVRKLNNNDFIDTMGFRIYRDHVTIRRRVFLRLRRAYKRALSKQKFTMRHARKCISYLGHITNTSSAKLAKRYRIYETARSARRVISYESKLRCRTA